MKIEIEQAFQNRAVDGEIVARRLTLFESTADIGSRPSGDLVLCVVSFAIRISSRTFFFVLFGLNRECSGLLMYCFVWSLRKCGKWMRTYSLAFSICWDLCEWLLECAKAYFLRNAVFCILIIWDLVCCISGVAS
ncbi:hypothetical protein E2542_SST17854 [Spatholobus suberectus]|nr:hypothetical protein E2542_SST17854 [Spatholobus suberectus]